MKLLQEMVNLFACKRTVKSIQMGKFQCFRAFFASKRVYVSYVAGCRETTG